MTTIRRFVCNDLFTFNAVNLDYFTETYHLPFYLQYLARWPEYCMMAEGPRGAAMGYILGKVEGKDKKVKVKEKEEIVKNWHGHVTAVTVAPEFRRQGLANQLMSMLEDVTDRVHHGWFVDLFVRVSNINAINMYFKMGYTLYRRVLGYYSGEEDAHDMRKAMSRDKELETVVPRERPIYPDELEHD
eukprot:jgi/Botrbrau1/7056/Bobra.0165s0079.1